MTLALGPSVGTASAARGFPYKVVEAQRDVSDVGEEVTDYAAKWNGDGHQHDKMQAPDEELPPLPQPVIPNKKSSIGAATDVITDGSEDLIDAEGKREACSGVWGEEDQGFLNVELNDKGKKPTSSWEIPTDLASHNCGFLYDQFPSPYKVKGTVSGQVGDQKIVMKTKDTKVEQEILSRGVITQTLKWEGRMILKRVKTPFG